MTIDHFKPLTVYTIYIAADGPTGANAGSAEETRHQNAVAA
jgi:hypothetical protein